MRSALTQGPRVPFPAFTGEREYMLNVSRGLPPSMKRWQPTIDAMLDGIKAARVYLMIDQAEVGAGELHRRGGLHVDLAWACKTVLSEELLAMTGLSASIFRHEHEDRSVSDQLIVMASDVFGCRAYVGDYYDVPSKGGDCSHVDTMGMTRVDLAPCVAWAGSAMRMLHESVPLVRRARRTMVRLNVDVVSA